MKALKAGKRDNEPTLEMIDPEIGWITGNVIVISRLASRMVNKMPREERLIVMRRAASGEGVAKA